VAAHHDDLAEAIPPGCAGVAFARHASDQSSLMAWRPAQPRLETWAGDPLKRVTGVGRISPRKSFELWQQRTQDKSAPWPHETADSCKTMLAILCEVGWTLNRRRAEQAAHEARRAAQGAKAKLEYKALHDALTDLPNRRYLETYLHRIKTQVSPPGTRIAALHLDLDRFKSINDTMGHAMGDIALQHVARALQAETRETDFTCRLGGDEFIVIACERTDEVALCNLSKRIISEFSKPLSIDGEIINLGASIGIAYAPSTGFDPAALLSRADIALYEAKRSGGGRFCFASDEMEQERIKRRRLGDDVQRGFAAGEFEMYFQLQFAAGSRAVAGAEALLRWHHPIHGTLTPYAFLEAAEDIGLIEKLDAFAVDAALDAHAKWAAAGLNVPKLSVNVSSRRLQNLDVTSLVAERPEIPDIIAFELLESMDLNEMDAINRWKIEKIREAGIALEVDDFGSGHTSILSLMRIKPDRIKIDRDLVIPAINDGAALEIVRSIVTIAHSLGIAVTAEGIETEQHAKLMEQLGCDVLQGFGLARPRDVATILRQHQMSGSA
jgi:diguanylate cyclase (GGDEF)-like protein